MGQCFADNHRPRLAQALHAQRIGARLVTLEMRRAVGGDVIVGVDIVFHGYRYAVQRAEVLALGEQLISLAGLGQCHGGIDLNEGIEDRVQPLDAVQGGLGQFDAGQATRAQAGGQVDDRLAKEISSVGRFRQAHTDNSIKQLRE